MIILCIYWFIWFVILFYIPSFFFIIL